MRLNGTVRIALACALVCLGPLVAVLVEAARRPPAPAAASPVTVLYVGADDCAPCLAWQRGAGAAFKASPEFARITYREVKSRTTLDVLDDGNWPDDLRPYRAAIGRGSAVPLWLVIVDGQVVVQSFGESQWARSVLPKIRSLSR